MKIQTEMTPEERAEMERLLPRMFRDDHRITFSMGFLMGKLSAVTEILNNSSIYNGTIKLGGDGGDKSSSPEAVPGDLEQQGPKRDGRDGDGSGEDKASD
jgi:hypothetical protein